MEIFGMYVLIETRDIQKINQKISHSMKSPQNLNKNTHPHETADIRSFFLLLIRNLVFALDASLNTLDLVSLNGARVIVAAICFFRLILGSFARMFMRSFAPIFKKKKKPYDSVSRMLTCNSTNHKTLNIGVIVAKYTYVPTTAKHI